MKVAFDLDGTIDAAPGDYLSLMSALMAAGHKVYVLTGIDDKKVSKQDIKQKEAYLESLGVGRAYDKLKVFPNPPHVAKAAYCDKHGIDLMIDNSTATAQLAAGYCVVLVPWATRQ